MNQDYILQLKKLKLIEPDPEFIRRSRAVILTSRPKAVFTMPAWLWIGATAAAVVMISLITYLSIFSVKPVLSASLDLQNLNNELNDLTINIELNEVKYEQIMGQTIASAINEISDTGTKHLNSSLLEQEKKNLDVNGNEVNLEIDKLLEQVIF